MRQFAFADPKWQQPFHHDIPEFPVFRRSKRKRTEMMVDNTVHGSNVPAHLPNYPPKHTYSRKTKKLKSEIRESQVKAIAATKSIQTTLAKIENSESK